ncbi:MAG: DNA primase [Clostridiales bacterium]|jgi:DNA primase|nr:DNA primase [Clostridiales bacterium]
MRYPHEIIEDVLAGNDIVSVVSGYVQLKQKGADYFGLCPFHQEKTPSFSVSADKQLYYCFGCGAGGNVLSFVMQIENLNFLDALRSLADRIHYYLPDAADDEDAARQARLKETLLLMHQKAARFFYDRLQSADGQNAAAYLDERGVLRKARIKFGLGYAPGKRALSAFLTKEGYPSDLLEKSGLVISDRHGGFFDRFSERLMFPIFDPRGRVIAFGGRLLGGGEPKYLNSPETPIFSKSHHLYGVQLAKKSTAKEFILVEGYMDVISLHQAGFSQAVAALGTSFNAGHAKLLRQYCESCVALFDSDKAGTKAALRAIPVLLAAGLRVKVLQVHDAKDPDEYIKSFGSERFAELLSQAQSYITFQVNQLKSRYNLENTGDRVAFTTEAAKIVAKADSAIERDAYGKEIAVMANISQEAVASAVAEAIAEAIASEAGSENGAAFKTPLKGRGGVNALPKAMEKGALEAQKSLIYFAAAHDGVCRALRPVLEPHELGAPVYAKLLETVYDWRGAGKEIAPAALINLFENLEEQRMVSEIFSRTPAYENAPALEKAINEMIKLIKQVNIDKKIPDAEWNQLQNLVEKKRNINQLYISISDG